MKYLISALLLLGFSSADVFIDLGDPASLERIENEVITLSVNETLTIIADENPSTGYTWFYEETDYDNALALVEDDYVHDAPATEADLVMVGVGGTRVLKF